MNGPLPHKLLKCGISKRNSSAMLWLISKAQLYIILPSVLGLSSDSDLCTERKPIEGNTFWAF